MGEKEFKLWLGDQDRIVARISSGHNRDVEYSLQYEARFDDGDHWEPIRRYDCAHGQVPHVHMFRPGEPDSTRQDDQAAGTNKDGLSLANSELRHNWERYRREYLEAQDELVRRILS